MVWLQLKKLFPKTMRMMHDKLGLMAITVESKGDDG